MFQKPVGKYSFRRFDPSSAFNKPFNMVLLGRKHTGKSCLMRDILYHLHRQGYPRIVIFSGTEEGNHFFSSHVPSAYVHNHLDIGVIQTIVDTQRQVIASVKEAEEKLGRPTGIDTRVVILLDDVVYQRGVLSNDTFRNIFFQGRHNNISLILAAQYLMYVPVEQRGNIDYLVVLREHIPKNKARLYESFFGCFPDSKTFYYVLDSLTQNYEVCVLDNTGSDTLPEHCVRFYKAQLNLPPFRFATLR